MQSSGVLISEHTADQDKPLTIRESVGGVIVNDGVTVAPGGRMTSIVIGKGASPQQIGEAIDGIKSKKKSSISSPAAEEKKSSLSESAQQPLRNIHMDGVSASSVSMNVLSSAASKEDQIAMALRMREAFNNPGAGAAMPMQSASGSESAPPSLAQPMNPDDPVIYNGQSSVGSRLAISVSSDAPEEAQVAVAEFAAALLSSQSKKRRPVQAIPSSAATVTKQQQSTIEEKKSLDFEQTSLKFAEDMQRILAHIPGDKNASSVPTHSSARIVSSLSTESGQPSLEYKFSQLNCNSLDSVIIGDRGFARLDRNKLVELSPSQGVLSTAPTITAPDKQQQSPSNLTDSVVRSDAERRRLLFIEGFNKRQGALSNQDNVKTNNSHLQAAKKS